MNEIADDNDFQAQKAKESEVEDKAIISCTSWSFLLCSDFFAAVARASPDDDRT